MLINLSNHPSDKWDKKQTQAALKLYGTIEDLPFPAIDPASDENEITELAQKYLYQCTQKLENVKNSQNAVHVQGEFTFVYHLVNLLKQTNITCIASTSERNVIKEKDGTKTLIFNFVRFREYV